MFAGKLAPLLEGSARERPVENPNPGNGLNVEDVSMFVVDFAAPDPCVSPTMIVFDVPSCIVAECLELDLVESGAAGEDCSLPFLLCPSPLPVVTVPLPSPLLIVLL